MKRKGFCALWTVFLCAAILAGCGSQISEEEYAAVCAERDALRTQLEELQNSPPAEEDGTVQVTIGGTFTATVRELIPDYVTDDVTPNAAVVTLFQSTPFVLFTQDAGQLEPGEQYVFTIREKQVEMTEDEYESGLGFLEEAMYRYGLGISDFRIAEEGDIGLDSVHLTARRDEK